MADQATIFARFVRESAKAICIDYDGQVWIPKSQVKFEFYDIAVNRSERRVAVVLPTWLLDRVLRERNGGAK